MKFHLQEDPVEEVDYEPLVQQEQRVQPVEKPRHNEPTVEQLALIEERRQQALAKKRKRSQLVEAGNTDDGVDLN